MNKPWLLSEDNSIATDRASLPTKIDIESAQESLLIGGYLMGVPNGYFDPDTKKAIEDLQRDYNLPITGNIDPQTQLILQSLQEPPQVDANPPLRKKDKNKFVQELQLILDMFGYYTGQIDSYFGNGTKQAVLELQADHQITQDGQVGAQTWGVINELFGNGPMHKREGAIDQKLQPMLGVVIDMEEPYDEEGLSLCISKYMANRFHELRMPYVMNYDRLTQNPFVELGGAIVVSNRIEAGDKEGTKVIAQSQNAKEIVKQIATDLQQAGQKMQGYETEISSDRQILESLVKIKIIYGFITKHKKDILWVKKHWRKSAEIVIKILSRHIKIPYTPPFLHKVAKDDTIASVAKKHHMTPEKLAQCNNLSSDFLHVGQSLYIPDDDYRLPPKNCIAYTVCTGDTLPKIAKKFNVSKETMEDYNHIKRNSIAIGQQVFIPTKK